MKKILNDIHLYLIITLTSLSILLFNVFGFFGIIVYGLLVIYGFLFFLFNVKSKHILKTPPLYVMIAYYAYFCIALCINGAILQRGFTMAQLFLLSLISFFIRPNEDLEYDIKQLSKIMTIASIVMSCSSIAIAFFTYMRQETVSAFPEYIRNIFFTVTGNFPTRMAGFSYQPNLTAEFCLISTMFSVFLIVSKPSKLWKVCSVLNIIASIFTIFVATSSRTSMVCILAFFFIFFCLFMYINKENMQFKRKMIYILLCLGFVVLLVLILFFASESFRNFVRNHVIRVSSLSTASGRDSVYKVAFELGKGHRLFGYNESNLAERIAPHAHNMYLQLLSFAGIPGLLLYCIYLGCTVYLAFKNFFDKSFSYNVKLLNCLFLSFVLCYLLYGIPEEAGVNRIKAISIYAQVIFGFIHVLHYNIKHESNILSYR